MTIGIGLLGLGTVGAGVAEILLNPQGRHPLVSQLALKRVAVRDVNRPRPVDLPAEILCTDPQQVVNDPAVDIVVEVMGGLEPARSLILAAIAAGKPVVTANKAVIARYGEEIAAAASERFADQFFFPMVQSQRVEYLHSDIMEAEIGWEDLVACCHDDRAVHGVPQLSDVSGPMVFQKFLPRYRTQMQTVSASLFTEMVQEDIDQQADVGTAFAERRNPQLKNAQPIKQVFSKSLFPDKFLQIPVRRGDHSNIDFDFGGRTDGMEWVAFQDTQ